uniref:Uncharacterized protein n=1 Tax=Ditylenchus dipsaci TaxID=166011 RepID=A0A915E8Z3_9BILA
MGPPSMVLDKWRSCDFLPPRWINSLDKTKSVQRDGAGGLQVIDICQCQFQFSFLDSMTTRRVFVVQRSPAIAKHCYGVPRIRQISGSLNRHPSSNCKSANLLNDGMVYKASAGSWFDTLTSPITAVSNAVNKGADTVQITVIIASLGMWSCCVIISLGILSLLHTCIREGRQDKLKRRKARITRLLGCGVGTGSADYNGVRTYEITYSYSKPQPDKFTVKSALIEEFKGAFPSQNSVYKPV